MIDIKIIIHSAKFVKGTSGAPESRSHGSVTLHPVHVFVRKRTHSVQSGSLLSHTIEIKGTSGAPESRSIVGCDAHIAPQKNYVHNGRM